MASTSFKKVPSEPFVRHMIIGYDNVWHEDTSLFAQPLVCILAICMIDGQCKMNPGSRSDETRCMCIAIQTYYFTSSTMTYFCAEHCILIQI